MNGIMMLETGNLPDVKNKYLPIYDLFQYPDHLFFFGIHNIKKLCMETGFEVIKTYNYSILYELFFGKILVFTLDLISKSKMLIPAKYRSSNLKNESTKSTISSINKVNKKPIVKRIIRRFLDDLVFFLRYNLGYIVPKVGRPQTIIYVIRKCREV